MLSFLIDLHFEVVTVIENAVDLALRDVVPDLMERNYVVKPCNFSHELCVISFVLGFLGFLFQLILYTLVKGPLKILEQF